MKIMWLFVAFAICGNLFIIYKKPQGFIYWIVADLAFFTYNLCKNDYAHAAIFFLYTVLSMVGLYKWTDKTSD